MIHLLRPATIRIGFPTATVLLSIACGQSGIIDNNAQLTSGQTSELVDGDTPINSRTDGESPPCAADSTACTPTGFGGQVYAGSVMLGERANGGLGAGAFAMTFLADDDAIIQRPDIGSGGSLTFDLADPQIFSGRMQVPAEADMPADPIMSRAEFSFDHLDARFTLTGTANPELDKAWVVRTVFVRAETVDGLDYVGGDLCLSPDDGERWKWCDASGCSWERPEAPFALGSVVNALASAAEREGNPDYASYSTDFPGFVPGPYDVLTDATRLWSIDFDLSGAIQWAAPPSTFDSESDILENFRLAYGCNYAGCDSEVPGVIATLTVGDPGTAAE